MVLLECQDGSSTGVVGGVVVRVMGTEGDAGGKDGCDLEFSRAVGKLRSSHRLFRTVNLALKRFKMKNAQRR